MKKLIAIMLTGIMVLVLASCGSNSDFEGEWKAVSVDTEGQQVSPAEQAMIDEILKDYTISIKSDGTAVFTRADKSSSMEATWNSEEDTITFKTTEEGEIKGELKDGKLIFDMDGSGKLVFEKK